MPSLYSIDRPATSVGKTHGHENTTPEIKTAKHRNKSISLIKNAGNSATSFLNRLYCKASAHLSSLFQGKRTTAKYVVTPGNPARLSTVQFQEQRGKYTLHIPLVNVVPAFEDALDKRNLRSSATGPRFERQLQDAAAGGRPFEPGTEPGSAVEPAEMAQNIEQHTAPAPIPQEDAISPILEDLPNPASIPGSALVITTAPEQETMVAEQAPPEAAAIAEIMPGNSDSTAKANDKAMSKIIADIKRPISSPKPERDSNRWRSAAYLQVAAHDRVATRPVENEHLSVLNVIRAGHQMPPIDRENPAVPRSVINALATYYSALNTQGRFQRLGTAPRPVANLYATVRALIQADRSDTTFSGEPAKICDVVAGWFPRERRVEIARLWHLGETPEPAGLAQFSEFLQKLGRVTLGDLPLHSTASFRTEVQGFLTELSESLDLFKHILCIAVEAEGHCADRMLFLYLEMKNARVLYDAKAGKLNVDELVKIGRQQFRHEALAKKAAVIVEKQLNSKLPKLNGASHEASNEAFILRQQALEKLRASSEELETYLRLKIANNHVLDLELPFSDMHHAACSGVSDEEVAAVAKYVKKWENAEFVPWLAKWAPWTAYMENWHRQKYGEIAGRMHEAIDALQTELTAVVLAEIKQKVSDGSVEKDMTPLQQNGLVVRLSKEHWQRREPDILNHAMKELAERLGHPELFNWQWPSQPIAAITPR